LLLARRLVNGRERGCLQVVSCSVLRLVNMSTRAMRLKTQARALACLQVVYLTLSVVKEQSLSASLVWLEKELFPLYLGHPLRGLLPSVVGGHHEKWPIRASLRHPASARFAIRPTASGDMLAIYIYVFGSQSCATRLIFAGSAPLIDIAFGDSASLRGIPAGGGEASRAWHPREFGAVLGGSASLPLPAPPLPSSSRRYAPRIRRTASPHVAQFGTRPLVPCLTFHKARFVS